MSKFSSLCLGATLAATTMTAVALAPSAAFAVVLNGTLSLEGTVDLGNPADGNAATTHFNWIGNPVVNAISGDFLTFAPSLAGSSVTVQNLSLVRNELSASATNTYSFVGNEPSGSFSNYISFGNYTFDGTTADLSFDLTGGTFTRSVFGNNVISVTLEGITGEFKFDGRTIATGGITGTQSGSTAAGGISLTATAVPVPVPEPITHLGIGLGLGVGAVLKKRFSHSGKKTEGNLV
ncbi:MAG: PEP-CTERM sorting domain-containing protein [Nodularia sp. CChRGM 3473]